MSCPNCGGSEHIPIAPGYWECRSLIRFEVRRPDPVYGTTMVPYSDSRVCGNRYQEIDSRTPVQIAETCACGTYAIGRCVGCQQAICGDHSGITRGARLCGSCRASRDAARQQADDEAKTARLADDKSYVAAFLAAAAKKGFPGTDGIYAAKQMLSDRDKRKLIKAARVDHERKVFGVNLSDKRRKKLDAQRGAAEVEREISERNREEPLARGWRVSSHVQHLPQDRGDDIVVTHHVYLLTDGKTVTVRDDTGRPRFLVPGYGVRIKPITQAELSAAVRSLADRLSL